MTIEAANSSTRVEAVWCVDCGGRFTAQETENCWGCPTCGSQGVPCRVDQDIRVEINWHELRILCIWAENYARACAANGETGENGAKMPATVLAIARRLQRQFPDLVRLTLSEEIAALPAELENAGIHLGGVESNVPRPEPIAVNGPGAVGHSRAADHARERLRAET